MNCAARASQEVTCCPHPPASCLKPRCHFSHMPCPPLHTTFCHARARFPSAVPSFLRAHRPVCPPSVCPSSHMFTFLCADLPVCPSPVCPPSCMSTFSVCPSSVPTVLRAHLPACPPPACPLSCVPAFLHVHFVCPSSYMSTFLCADLPACPPSCMSTCLHASPHVPSYSCGLPQLSRSAVPMTVENKFKKHFKWTRRLYEMCVVDSLPFVICIKNRLGTNHVPYISLCW